jgi:hypothetical protein
MYLPEIRNVEASTNFGDYRVYQDLALNLWFSRKGRAEFARPFFACEGLRAMRLLSSRVPHGSQNVVKESCSACTLENPSAEVAA